MFIWRLVFLIIFGFIFITVTPSDTFAFSNYVNYQGRVFDSTGGFVTDGCKTVEFDIAPFDQKPTKTYQSLAPSPSRLSIPNAGITDPSLDSTGCASGEVYVKNGLFNALLDVGDYDNFFTGHSYYGIRIRFNSNRPGDASAWQPFTPTGMAISANKLAGAASGENNVLGDLSVSGKIAATGHIYSNTQKTDAIFNGNPATTTSSNTPNFIGSGGYWALRTNTANAYNLDVYNAGAPITAMTVLQSGKGILSNELAVGGTTFANAAGSISLNSSGVIYFTANNTVLKGNGGLNVLDGTQTLRMPVRASDGIFTGNVSGASLSGANISATGTITAGTNITASGNITSNTTKTDTVFNGNPLTGSANFIGSGGYWALRTNATNAYNLDVYNAGAPITAMTVLQSGKVGIGTTTPGSTLEVNGAITLGGPAPDWKTPRFINYIDANQASFVTYGTNAFTYYKATKDFEWFNVPTGSTKLTDDGRRTMALNTAGNLTVSGNIEGASLTGANIKANNQICFGPANCRTSWPTFTEVDTLQTVTGRGNNTDQQILLHDNGTADDSSYNGRLAITREPTSGQYINLTRAGNLAWSIGTVYNNNNFAIGKGEGSDLNFRNPAFVIAFNNNVGIGTTTPAAKLAVQGTPINDSGQQILIGATDDNRAYNNSPAAGIAFGGKYTSVGADANFGGLDLVKANTTSGDAGSIMRFYTRDTGVGPRNIQERMRIGADGNIGIGTTTTTSRLNVDGHIRLLSTGKVLINNDTAQYVGSVDNKVDPGLISNSARWIRIGGKSGIAFWGKPDSTRNNSGAIENNDPDVFLKTNGDLEINRNLCLGADCRSTWPSPANEYVLRVGMSSFGPMQDPPDCSFPTTTDNGFNNGIIADNTARPAKISKIYRNHQSGNRYLNIATRAEKHSDNGWGCKGLRIVSGNIIGNITSAWPTFQDSSRPWVPDISRQGFHLSVDLKALGFQNVQEYTVEAFADIGGDTEWVFIMQEAPYPFYRSHLLYRTMVP